MPAVPLLHRLGHGEIDPHAVLRNSDRSTEDGSRDGFGQHHLARPSRNRQGAQDARVGTDRRARALDEKERDHPGRPDAPLGAVRYLLDARDWTLEVRTRPDPTGTPLYSLHIAPPRE